MDSFDVSSIVGLHAGELIGDVVVLDDEVKREEFGIRRFKDFFNEVGNLQHIKVIAANDKTVSFDPRLHSKVHTSFKNGIQKLIWRKEFSKYLLDCFTFPGTTNIERCYGSQVISFKEVKPEPGRFELIPKFTIEFADHTKLTGQLDEDKFLKVIFTESPVYNTIGRTAMICVDVANALGGSEAIAESFYSVMKHHAMDGEQSPEVLENRGIIDWGAPNRMRADKLCRSAGKSYRDGVKDDVTIRRHEINLLKNISTNSFRSNRILTRLNSEVGRYTFLNEYL